jgi:Domain of unknown function (DUF4333)
VARGWLAGLVLVSGLACAGCGGDLPLTQREVEDYVTTELDGADGVGDVSSVACEDGLPADEGASTSCSVSSAKVADLVVTVRATKDEGRGDLRPSLEYAMKISCWQSQPDC